jgi:hypothetical protein
MNALAPVDDGKFWRNVNEPHHWIKRNEVSRYWDCAKCGEFVYDMAPPQPITWPWRFNTVGPCARPSPTREPSP